ncbi:MAG: NAD(P)H-quinone oxidoreductase [Acidobacteriota bacterium]
MRLLSAALADGRYEARLTEAPIPIPGPGEVLVKVAASGVNRADLSQIAGRYPPPPGESEILGLEVSGSVVESGEKVCALVAGGAHAEYAAVPRGQLLPVPSRVQLLEAAGIPEAFLTAYLNLAIEGELTRGGRALVHAGASGVGLSAIQTARYLGARVAATTRSASKLAALRENGADPAIDSSVEPFAEAIERVWGPEGVDVVLDPLGAGTLAGDLRVLAMGGQIVFLATMSGARAELDIALLMRKRATVIGSTLRSRSREEKARLIERFAGEILPGFESGAISPSIDTVFPASRAAEALTRMAENRNVGKILLDWS